MRVFREATKRSERRACGRLETVRAMVRFRPRASRFAAANEKLRMRLRELAEHRRRWGYRRLHILLERECWQVNSKRVYRIYVDEKPVVRRRRRRACARARVLVAPPTRPNEAWTTNFLQDALAGGRKYRTLSIEDAYTREMPIIVVDPSLPALRVVRVLEKLRLERGLPERIVIDPGAEFPSKALVQWANENKVTQRFITPGRPMESGYIESSWPDPRFPHRAEYDFRIQEGAARCRGASIRKRR